jgi:predicted DNA-binding transcriptional regulator AlpA
MMNYQPQADVFEGLLREIRKITMVGAPRPFYPAKEAQQILGMSRSNMYRLMKLGRLEVRHVDKKIFITHRSMMRLVFGEDHQKAQQEFESGVADLAQPMK